MTTETTARKADAPGKRRRVVLLTLALGTALAAVVALAGVAQKAEAAYPGANGKIVFASTRTTGEGVNNPTGDGAPRDPEKRAAQAGTSG